MTVDIEREVARRLAAGALYIRSFHRVAGIVDRMCERGLLERVAPPNGQGRNMVALTAAGRRQYLRGDKFAAARARNQAQRQKRVEQFAEMLAEGYTISAAARVLGVSQQVGSQYLATMRAELGWQAQ